MAPFHASGPVLKKGIAVSGTKLRPVKIAQLLT